MPDLSTGHVCDIIDTPRRESHFWPCVAIACALFTATGIPLVWVLRVAEWLRGVA